MTQQLERTSIEVAQPVEAPRPPRIDLAQRIMMLQNPLFRMTVNEPQAP